MEIINVHRIDVSDEGVITAFCKARTDEGEVLPNHVLRFHPGDDITGAPERVQHTARKVWTEEVVAAYQASLTEDE